MCAPISTPSLCWIMQKDQTRVEEIKWEGKAIIQIRYQQNTFRWIGRIKPANNKDTWILCEKQKGTKISLPDTAGMKSEKVVCNERP